MSSADLQDRLQQALGAAYAIERELGGGGMSRVFVADEAALGRRVVVKVLRPELGEGLSAERFKREVRLAARLQHPHIVPLLAAGELDGGVLYYTMPFVEGESLRARLGREGALPVADAVRVLHDVASALSYAHRASVVHRDVKPENVLLADGGAVVADFGIAKAISASREPDGADDTRRSSTLTAAGTSLGTPTYMAPEQAAGDAVDHRADLYALGVVAYEMLAGRAPFDGRTAQQLLAAHATEAPEPVVRRRPAAPEALAALIMRLLEKSPADRPQSADEVLRTLDGVAAMLDRTQPVAAPPSQARRDGGTRLGRRARITDPVVLALALATVASVSALAWVILSTPGAASAPQPRAYLKLDLPAEATLNTGGLGSSVALSPDATSLVYVGGTPIRLFVRRLAELTPRGIAGTELATNPQFSPDGRWIAFLRGSSLWKMPAAGGPPVTIVADAGRFAWAPDGTIIFARATSGVGSLGAPLGGLLRVSAGGGTPQQLTTPDSALGGVHGSPVVLPGGKAVLFTAASAGGDLTLAAVRLRDRKVISLGQAGGSPAYLAGGYLAFARPDGSIAAVRFDAERLRVIGEPVPVLDSVAAKPNGAEFAVAPNGTMVYLRGTLGSQLVELDRRAGARVVVPAVRDYAGPRLSPDGRRLAMSIRGPVASDIWVHDMPSGTLTRLSSDGRSGLPAWTPDGRRVAWTSLEPGREGVWWRPWDASAPAELLVPGGRRPEFTPRADFVVASFEVAGRTEVRMVPIPYDATRPAQVILPAGAVDRQYRLSPDGRWLAYVSDETGTREVYVQPLPGPGGHFPISAGGGIVPVWAPSGRELFYIGTGCCMLSASIITTPAPTVVRRDTLFSIAGTRSSYDVTADGHHFVIARQVGGTAVPVVVFGWADEVREKVEAASKK